MKTAMEAMQEERERERLGKIMEILNDPISTWKVKRAVLREAFRVPEEMIRDLVPEPPET